MTAYRWIPGQKGGGGSVEEESAEWEEHWTVYGYAPPMGEPAAFGLLLDQPILRPGQRHYNPAVFAKVKTFDCDRLSSVNDAWVVVVTYRQEVTQGEEDPRAQPPEITLDSESDEVPVFLDADGKAILNTAGDLVAGLTEEITFWVFNVNVNLPAVPRWLLDYRNAVNSDSVRIGGITIDPGYLFVKTAHAGKVERPVVNGVRIEYVPFSFSVVYHPWGWKLRYFNRGLNEIIEVDESAPTEENPNATKKVRRKVRIMLPTKDGDEEPATEPQFLDRSGKMPRTRTPKIDPVSGEQETDENDDPIWVEGPKAPLEPEDIVVLERWTKQRLPFSRLPIR